MKKWVWIGGILLLWSACGGGGGGEPAPSLTVSSILLEPVEVGPISSGQTLFVRLRAQNVAGLFQGAFRVVFDTSRLQFLSFTPSDFLQRQVENPTCLGLLTTVNPFPQTGVIAVSISRKGTSCGPTDKINGEVGVFSFTALQNLNTYKTLVVFPADIVRFRFRNETATNFSLERLSSLQVKLIPPS